MEISDETLLSKIINAAWMLRSLVSSPAPGRRPGISQGKNQQLLQIIEKKEKKEKIILSDSNGETVMIRGGRLSGFIRLWLVILPLIAFQRLFEYRLNYLVKYFSRGVPLKTYSNNDKRLVKLFRSALSYPYLRCPFLLFSCFKFSRLRP